jgi:hypothetical protein
LRYDTIVLQDMSYDGLKENIKDAMLSQNFNPHTSALTELTNRALQIDTRLEAYKPARSSTTTHAALTKNSSNTHAAPSTSTPLLHALQDRLNKGDLVFMIGADGKAKKGVITNIGKNAHGFATPTVQWNRSSETVSIPFGSIKRDNRPSTAVTSPKADLKGPGPMDIDSAGKGKTVPTCNICRGKGHFAKVCPSCATSGYDAAIEEEGKEIETGKEDT